MKKQKNKQLMSIDQKPNDRLGVWFCIHLPHSKIETRCQWTHLACRLMEPEANHYPSSFCWAMSRRSNPGRRWGACTFGRWNLNFRFLRLRCCKWNMKTKIIIIRKNCSHWLMSIIAIDNDIPFLDFWRGRRWQKRLGWRSFLLSIDADNQAYVDH